MQITNSIETMALPVADLQKEGKSYYINSKTYLNFFIFKRNSLSSFLTSMDLLRGLSRLKNCISAKDETTDSSSDSIFSSYDEETVVEKEVIPNCSYQKQNQNRFLTEVPNQKNKKNSNKLEKFTFQVIQKTTLF
jgi:hypothetical protein